MPSVVQELRDVIARIVKFSFGTLEAKDQTNETKEYKHITFGLFNIWTLDIPYWNVKKNYGKKFILKKRENIN